jgi:hypothetical protein
MKHHTLSLLIIALLLPGFAMAQSETEIIPRYDVEVVIFKNNKVPKSREFILPVSSPEQDKNAVDLSSASSIAAGAKLGYEILPDSQFRLLEVVTRLVESSRYDLLFHAAWRQPGLEKKQVLPIWIRGGRIFGNEFTSIDNQIEMFESLPRSETGDQEGKVYEFDEQSLESIELQMLERQSAQGHQGLYELEGKITIALSRYLHTYTDLVLRRPRLSIDPVLTSASQNTLLAANSADTRILNNHNLKEHRRMRSKTLHYLDNPEFAMLILITPFKAPEEFEEVEPEVEPETSQ